MARDCTAIFVGLRCSRRCPYGTDGSLNVSDSNASCVWMNPVAFSKKWLCACCCMGLLLSPPCYQDPPPLAFVSTRQYNAMSQCCQHWLTLNDCKSQAQSHVKGFAHGCIMCKRSGRQEYTMSSFPILKIPSVHIEYPFCSSRWPPSHTHQSPSLSFSFGSLPGYLNMHTHTHSLSLSFPLSMAPRCTGANACLWGRAKAGYVLDELNK